MKNLNNLSRCALRVMKTYTDDWLKCTCEKERVDMWNDALDFINTEYMYHNITLSHKRLLLVLLEVIEECVCSNVEVEEK